MLLLSISGLPYHDHWNFFFALLQTLNLILFTIYLIYLFTNKII